MDESAFAIAQTEMLYQQRKNFVLQTKLWLLVVCRQLAKQG